MMTSTEETAGMDALKAEAKELGVTGWQAMKDPTKLQAKIDTAKASGPVRKKAPKMVVASVGENSRTKTLANLEKGDPDSKYITQSASKTHEEIAAKGLEVMKKPNGEVMYVGNDIVCRTERESYNEWQNQRTNHSLKAMQSIDKDLEVGRGGKRIQALTERTKQGFDSE
jgi:hypothetical protein